jgi:NAD(P)-dependent dehydrogenase (short-subunit alcohol dehydrogenase family)
MGLLEGKVALVTGASTGMGRAIALRMAEEGARIGIVARSRDALEDTARQARELGAEVLAFAGDVADGSLARRVVVELALRFGRIDILINNAGTNSFHRNLADISEADWRRVMDTNVTGAFLFARHALRIMREAGAGQIINVSSGAALAPNPPAGVAYCASKHAMHSLTTSINLEERRHGIKACEIVPGETDTPNLDLRPLPPSREALAQMLRPEDVANAVIFAASQPPHVSVEMVVVNPTVRRNYQADYERYVSEGHTAAAPD